MSFLAPLFLAGAAAVALPLIFHLIRRSSRERMVFSSLMFLEPSPPRITKRSRLEHILLLLLRCAVVALLAFVFARPFLARPMAASNTPDNSTRVAILVDASASMRREDLFPQARERAVAAVRKLKPSDSFAVFLFDQQLRSVLGFGESARLAPGERASAVQARLDGVNPGWGATRLGHAILQATEQLLEQLNQDSREQGDTALRVVVVTDAQAGARLDGLQGFEWPRKMRVELDTVRAKEGSNAGLQILANTQRAFVSSTNAPIRVRVSNSSASKTEQFSIQWRREFEPAGEKVEVYVPSGQSRIVPAPARPETLNALTLQGDRVDFDNTAFFAQPKQRPVIVAYHGSEPAADPRGMRYYLHRAFEQTNLATRVLALSNSIPVEAQEAGLLVLGDLPTSAVTALAKSLLDQGRTVLLPIRDPAQANIISEFTGGLLVAAPEVPLSPGQYALFGKISFQHPLFAPFADAKFSDFTKIHFWKHRALNLANITNATVIATFDSGEPLLAEIPIGQGRLMVLGATWMPADSQLALSSKFVPLLFGILEQSAGLRSSSHSYLVGEAVPLPAAVTEVQLPNGEKKPVTGGRFTDTDIPGLYTAGEFQFAVNLDAAESKIAPLSPEDFTSLGVPLDAELNPGNLAAAEERNRHLLATETEAKQKLWRNFLLAALAFLLFETWLSGRLSRSPAAA